MKLGDYGLIFCIATKNKERSREFYENVLGLRFVKDDSFALVFDANGTELRISQVPEFVAIPYSVLGWTVPDIAGAVTDLQQAGVTFEKYGWFEQDPLGVWTAPDGTQVAWFKDPDGNILSLKQSAKE